MAFKFFNIGKANEEIDRLESSVAELTKERDALKENATAIETAADGFKSGLADANQKVAQAESELAAARSTIGLLTAERDAAVAAQKAAEAKLANPSAQIKEAAAVQALEITAKLGQPPVTSAPPPSQEKKEVKGRDRFLNAIKIS